MLHRYNAHFIMYVVPKLIGHPPFNRGFYCLEIINKFKNKNCGGTEWPPPTKTNTWHTSLSSLIFDDDCNLIMDRQLDVTNRHHQRVLWSRWLVYKVMHHIIIQMTLSENIENRQICGLILYVLDMLFCFCNGCYLNYIAIYFRVMSWLYHIIKLVHSNNNTVV